MYDPTEEQLVEQAARDALSKLNSLSVSGGSVGIATVTKRITVGNKVLRLDLTTVVTPARSSEDEG